MLQTFVVKFSRVENLLIFASELIWEGALVGGCVVWRNFHSMCMWCECAHISASLVGFN